jgi:hypothetical protein
MIYILTNRNDVVGITAENPFTGTPTLRKIEGLEYDGVIDKWDIKNFEQCEELAKKVTEVSGVEYQAADAGEHVSPRYSIFVPPKVGDKVSKSFNGDSYPCGEIVRITPKQMVITSTGHKFNRRKNSAGWKQVGGYSWMIGGHVDERNPHF